MSKINQSPKQPAEKRRTQLIEAAQKLFMKNGYRGTTIEQIARKARLTKGAFYHHFENKEDLLMGMFDCMGCDYVQSINDLVSRPTISPGEILEALFSAHKSVELTDFLNMIDMWVQARRLPKLRKQLETSRLEFVDLLSQKLDHSYGRTLAQRREVVSMVLNFYDGLAANKAMHSELIDLQAQQKLFARGLELLRKDSTSK